MNSNAKNRLRDFIETLCIFSNIYEHSLRPSTISEYRFNYLANFLLLLTKSLRIFSNFMTVAPEVISRRCLLVAVILWPMCCHTEMPLTQDTTPHPVTIYRHGAYLSLCYPRCGTSHWNTQLPIFLSWVRPAREILPDLSHTSEHSTWCCHGGQQSEAQ